MPKAPDHDRLAWENRQVLNLVQALIGAVTPNFRGVTLECLTEKVMLHFVIDYESEADREEIDDVVFEFEALQSTNVQVEVVVVVSQEPIVELAGRRVYGRKES